MRRSTTALFIALIALLVTLPLIGAGRAAGSGPAKRVLPAVQALLDRAEKAPAEQALRTLDQAARQAESARDAAGLQAVARMAYTLGQRRVERGEMAPAKAFFQQALAIRQKHAPDSLDVALSLNDLGNVADAQGDLAAAKEHHQRALAIREKHAPNSLDVAASLNNLGNVALDQGDLAAARALYERALAIYEKQTPGSNRVAAALNNLGIVAKSQGDLAAAKTFFQRALAIWEKQAPHSLRVAMGLNGLGDLTREQGDLAAARDLLQRALVIKEKLAPDSLTLANTLNNLGNVAYEQGDLLHARALHERAWAIREKHAPNSLAVASSLKSLGAVTYTQGDLAVAKERFQGALAIEEKFAPDSLTVAATLHNLGSVAWSRGDLAAAKERFQRALAIRERQAPGSLDIAQSLVGLGTVAQDDGDLDGAKPLYQRALAIEEKLAPDSLTVANTLNNLGNLLHDQGELLQARALHQRALGIREKHAPNSLDVAYSLNGLARVQDESGDAQAALASLRQALALLDQRAPHALLALTVLRQLARLLLESGADDEARAHLARAEQIEEAVKSLPVEPSAQGGALREVLPEVRFLAPAQQSEVTGDEVTLSVTLLSPLPLAGYRVWINGRPFGGERGFPLPSLDEPGRSPERGRILDKGRILEKGRILDKGEDRDAVARELPPDVAELARRLPLTQFQQLRLTLPIEETDGAFLRLALAAQTTGGTSSGREILRLRRPQAEARRGTLRVLAIGVGTYEHMPRLAFAADDARELAAALQTQAGADRLYRAAAAQVLTDRQATLPAIRQALAAFTQDVQPGDTLILLLSGHGVKEGEAFYFAPVELDPTHIGQTGLPWNEVLAQLQTARQKARAVWVLADCCRAAPGLGREHQATGKDLRRDVEEGGNLVICTASAGDAPSYESEDLKHGIFTQAWLEALQGSAPEFLYQETSRGRVLTLSGLQFILDASVIRHARQAGVRQRIEFPRLEGSFSTSQPIFVPVPATNLLDRRSGGGGRLLDK